MPAVTKICGFRRTGFNLVSNYNNLQVTEIVVIEAETPMTTAAAIQAALPSISSGPGTTTFNPKQLTFTLGASRHPDSSIHILNNILSYKKDTDDDRYWLLTVQYTTPTYPSFGYEAVPPSERRDQQVENPDADPEVEDQIPITDPKERPPIFSQTSKIVMAQRYYDIDGNQLIHTNLLPLDSPIGVPVVNRIYRWSFNIRLNKDYPTLLWEAENTCNDDEVTIDGPNPVEVVIPAGKLKCNSATVTEVWETPAGSTTEFHYLRANVELEQSVFRWDQSPVSMHMLERVSNGDGGFKYSPIKINKAGHIAKSPWPLQPDGTAVPYSNVLETTKGKIGVLDTSAPTSVYADWSPVKASDKIQTLLDEFNHELPR